MSCSTAASAPSMLMGSGLICAAAARSRARMKRDAVAGDAGLGGHVEEHGDARVGRVHAMAEAGQATSGSRVLRRSRAPPRPRIDSTVPLAAVASCPAIIAMHVSPAPPCSSPIASTPAADGRGHRLPVAGRREPGGGAGRRAGAVVGRRRRESRRAAAVRRASAAGRDAAERRSRRTRGRASATGRRIRAARCGFRRR